MKKRERFKIQFTGCSLQEETKENEVAKNRKDRTDRTGNLKNDSLSRWCKVGGDNLHASPQLARLVISFDEIMMCIKCMIIIMMDETRQDDSEYNSDEKNKTQAVGLVDASPRTPRHRPHGRVVTRWSFQASVWQFENFIHNSFFANSIAN